MSGVQYQAISMGPVPKNFNSIFEYLANKQELDIYYTNFPDGGVGEQFKPGSKKAFDSELFSANELNVLNTVAERFKNTSTSEMIEISHKEKAWMENNAEREMIDYNYSFELS